MRRVTSRQGDTVDLICHRYFGYTAGVTQQVMELNPNLAEYDLVLPQGVVLFLPGTPKLAEKQIIQLWT